MSTAVYRPTRTQYRFLTAPAPIKGFFGGYGSGKTYAGAQCSLRLAVENAGLPGLIVSPTWRMLQRTTLPTFRSVCPPGLIVDEKKQDGYFLLANGTQVFFGSADRPGSLEGMNLAWAWPDEARLMVLEAFEVIVGRVREKRASRLQTILTTTPAMGWLHEFFEAKAGADRASFHGSTRENAANLAPGYVERLLSTYSARKAAALVEGQFSILTGSVYEEFDERVHRVPWKFDPALRTGLMIDFGVASPSVLVFQVTTKPSYLPSGRTIPAGSCVIFDELHPDSTPTERLMLLVKARPWAQHLSVVYCDPAGNARSQETGRPSTQYVREALPDVDVRFSADPATRWIPNGIATVQAALMPASGTPTLYLADALFSDAGRRGLVKSLRGYAYPERPDGTQAGDIPVKDGVYDHACDALRYGVMGLERDESAGTRPARIRSVIGGVS